MLFVHATKIESRFHFIVCMPLQGSPLFNLFIVLLVLSDNKVLCGSPTLGLLNGDIICQTNDDGIMHYKIAAIFQLLPEEKIIREKFLCLAQRYKNSSNSFLYELHHLFVKKGMTCTVHLCI